MTAFAVMARALVQRPATVANTYTVTANGRVVYEGSSYGKAKACFNAHVKPLPNYPVLLSTNGTVSRRHGLRVNDRTLRTSSTVR